MADFGDKSVDGGDDRPGLGNPRSGRRPAFQFYPADFLMDRRVQAMTMAERGLYITLLSFSWREGSIPAAEPELIRLTKMPPKSFRQCWSRVAECWSPHPSRPGELVQARQERDRLDLRAKVQQARRAAVLGGRKSAKVRRPIEADGTPPGQPLQSPVSSLHTALNLELVPRDGNQPSLELSGAGAPTARWEEEFRVLWGRHPGRPNGKGRALKRNRQAAHRLYLAMKPTEDQARAIVSGHATACAGRQWLEGYAPDLHRWLRARGWEDEDIASAEPEDQRARWAREQRENSRRWLEQRKREREGGAA